jgi:hypothetical protein
MRFIAFSAFLLVFLPGCGDAKQIVNGTVTLDGEPVADGVVTFVKSEGELVREGAIIKDGHFQTHVLPGKYKLELNGRKIVGKRKEIGFSGAEEELEITEELFPERFNTQTELNQEIKSGAKTIKLDLKR